MGSMTLTLKIQVDDIAGMDEAEVIANTLVRHGALGLTKGRQIEILNSRIVWQTESGGIVPSKLVSKGGEE